MKPMIARTRFASVVTAMIMAQSGIAKTKPSPTRANYKQNFSNELLAIARGNSMVIPTDINPQVEAAALAYEMTDTIINTLIEKSAKLGALRPNPDVMTPKYKALVRKELANETDKYVPVGLHCMRGAYTGILNGVNALQIDLEIVPVTAQNACANFRHEMKTKYKGPDYKNCIYENVRVYKNRGDRDKAFERYIANARGGMPKDTCALLKKFSRGNIWVGELNRGCVFVVKGPAGRAHAISYVGRGHVNDKGNFVSSEDGMPTTVGFNRESLNDIFGKSNVVTIPFIADIYNITVATLILESEKFNIMSRPELIDYLIQNNEELKTVQPFLASIRQEVLVKLALSKYFGNDFVKTEPMGPLVNSYCFDAISTYKQYTM